MELKQASILKNEGKKAEVILPYPLLKQFS